MPRKSELDLDDRAASHNRMTWTLLVRPSRLEPGTSIERTK